MTGPSARVAFWLLLASATTTTSAAELTLRLSGTDYEGSGPAFAVLFGETTIGAGTVDTSVAGGQVFTFNVPDTLLAPNDDLRIRFTNDARKAPDEDRNLYLIAADLNGADIPLSSFVITRPDLASVPKRLRNGTLQIWSGNEVAVAAAPPGGWLPDATTKVTEAPKRQQEAAVDAPDVCDLSVMVTGYDDNAVDLAASQEERLLPVIDRLRGGNCAVLVTGYASLSGSAETNALVSGQRADAVLSYLRSQVQDLPHTQARGAGSTDQFGSAPEANRIVVVELTTRH